MGATKSVELNQSPEKFRILDKGIPNKSTETDIVYTQNEHTITVSQKVNHLQLTQSNNSDIICINDFLWNEATYFKNQFPRKCPVCNDFIHINSYRSVHLHKTSDGHSYRVLGNMCCPDCIKIIRTYQPVDGVYYIQPKRYSNAIFEYTKDQIRCNVDIPITWFHFNPDFQVSWAVECQAVVNDLILRKLVLSLNATRHMDVLQDIRDSVIAWLIRSVC